MGCQFSENRLKYKGTFKNFWDTKALPKIPWVCKWKLINVKKKNLGIKINIKSGASVFIWNYCILLRAKPRYFFLSLLPCKDLQYFYDINFFTRSFERKLNIIWQNLFPYLVSWSSSKGYCLVLKYDIL